jgi:phosphate transport system substrate-binding protein
MKKVLFVSIAIIALSACTGNKNKSGKPDDVKVDITAAGATFPQPFYNQVFSDYTAKTGNKLTYGGIGSGGGIRSLKDRVVDFGATDAFLTDEQAAELPALIVHVPTCLGAVVIAFNLPGITELKLKNDVLASIFLGTINKWNDNLIKADNPGLNLPDKKISVVYRSDGSGTTYIFSDYLSKINKEWE